MMIAIETVREATTEAGATATIGTEIGTAPIITTKSLASRCLKMLPKRTL